MLGLIYKDLKMQKIALKSLIISMVIVFVIVSDEMSAVTAISTLLVPLVVYSYISVSTTFDKFYNVEGVFFSLPVKRSEVVLCKYINFIVALGIGIIVSLIAAYGLTLKGIGDFTNVWNFKSVMFGAVSMGAMSNIMIPINLKFGAAKGKLISILIFGVAFGAYFSLAQKGDLFMEIVNGNGVIAASVAYGVTLLASFPISLKIVKDKEC